MGDNKSDPITLRLPKWLLRKVDEVAKAEGRTRSNAIVVLLARALRVKL